MKTYIVELLNELFSSGTRIWVEDYNLRCQAPQGVLTDAHRAGLKKHKQDIINLLSGKQDIFMEYPLSLGQQALWFINKLAPEYPEYNVGFAFIISSDFDVPVLRNAFQALINRHPSLRTTFYEKDGEVLQRVHGYQQINLSRIDASKWDEDKLRNEVQKAHYRPFDLEKGPAVRAELFVRPNNESDKGSVFLLSIHHIVTDGWSLRLILEELGKLYEAEQKKEPAMLPQIEASYIEYVQSEAKMLESPEGEKLWEYWKEQLSGDLPVLNLPTDHPRPPVQTYNGATVYFDLNKELTRKLKKLSRQKNATLYMTLLAAFHILLHRYTGQEDIIVSSPTAGRSGSEFVKIMGYFVNMIASRAVFSEDLSFEEFLHNERNTVVEGLRHAEYPFTLLVKRLQVRRDAAYLPIAQASFSLLQPQLEDGIDAIVSMSASPKKQFDLGGMTISFFKLRQQEGQFDIFLEIFVEKENSLSAALKYNTDIFDHNTIERMAGHFKMLLKGIVDNPSQKISELPILTEEERHKLLVEFNNTKAEYPKDKCVHQLFEEQAEKIPDAVAVVFEDKQITYKELNEKANQLAHHLQTIGVGPEVFVGICTNRTIEMIAGILGILKAGGAYIPMDPDYPADRLSFYLQDAGAEILLTQKEPWDSFSGRIESDSLKTIIYLDNNLECVKKENTDNPTSDVTPQNLAYILYTSGSTGKPKGVAIEHHSPCALASWGQDIYSKEELSGMLASTTICFDLSVYEIFLTLSVGGKLILAQNALKLPEIKAKQEVTIVNTVPSAAKQLLQMNGIPKNVQTINLAGEPLAQSLVDKLYEIKTIKKVYDLYGPSEDTTYSTFTLREKGGFYTIGKPLHNTQAYILDKKFFPVPIGVAGELHISGQGLARGYLNRPELTIEKFIPNPFSNDPNSRLYKTGDLASWFPDGNIKFFGRIDFQVKIRGFRIELGEIQAVLLKHPFVKENVVVVKEDKTGDKRLIAYIEKKQNYQDESEDMTNELKRHLSKKLPDYMIPSFFVFMDALPLTPNGKIDRKSLPDPQVPVSIDADAIPQNKTEKIIADIWKEALNIEAVGIYDNFFDIGGHSLLIVQINQKLETVLNQKLSIPEMFQYPTIHALAQHIAQTQDKDSVSEQTDERAKKRISRRNSMNRQKKVRKEHTV